MTVIFLGPPSNASVFVKLMIAPYYGIPLFIRHFVEHGILCNAGIVYQNVDRFKLVHYHFYRISYLFFNGNIALDEQYYFSGRIENGCLADSFSAAGYDSMFSF